MPSPASGPGMPNQASLRSEERRLFLQKQLRKTKVCSYHLRGACVYGEACTFAHGTSELQDAPDLRKTVICQAHLAGDCTDAECRFAHGEEELRPAQIHFKKAMCVWHEKGKCRYGKSCRFAHGWWELRDGGAPTSPGHGPGSREGSERSSVSSWGEEPVQVPSVGADVARAADVKTLCSGISRLTAKCDELQQQVQALAAAQKQTPRYVGTYHTLASRRPALPGVPACAQSSAQNDISQLLMKVNEVQLQMQTLAAKQIQSTQYAGPEHALAEWPPVPPCWDDATQEQSPRYAGPEHTTAEWTPAPLCWDVTSRVSL